MELSFKQLEFERHGDVYCVRLSHNRFDESGLEDLSKEAGRLIDDQGCRKMVLALGPEDTLCLYSVFLAKLVNLQRRLASAGGALALAGLSDTTQHIFQVAGLSKFFTFYPNTETAVKALGQKE
jgi:anti-anti-sigma factor